MQPRTWLVWDWGWGGAWRVVDRDYWLESRWRNVELRMPLGSWMVQSGICT